MLTILRMGNASLTMEDWLIYRTHTIPMITYELAIHEPQELMSRHYHILHPRWKPISLSCWWKGGSQSQFQGSSGANSWWVCCASAKHIDDTVHIWKSYTRAHIPDFSFSIPYQILLMLFVSTLRRKTNGI